MKFPDNIKVYGDTSYRGDCPKEAKEQTTFFNRLRKEYPDTWGKIATHIKNESKRYKHQAARDKALGMTTGASDIIIPGSPAFVCELKRKDHTESRIGRKQVEYLIAAQNLGAFACIALGVDGAWDAFQDYLNKHHRN